MLVQNLFDVLPVLALVGLGLNSLEALPTVAAHTQPARAHHRHLAEKARLASNLGARAKQPGQNLIIRRGPNGKACRVRGESKTAPAVVSSTFIDVTSSITPSVVPTTTEVAVAFETTAIVPVSSAVAPSQYQAPQSQAPATNPAPAPSQAPAPSDPGSSYQGGGSGWANSGSKLGIAWPNGDWAQPQDPNYIANYIGSKASWYYTWSPYCVKSADDHGLEFVPMLWGVKQIGDWHSQQASWPNTVKNALFFNEPNDAGQAHIDASNAVQYWMNDFLPVRQRGIKLGAAAVTNAPSGIVWVREMIETCVSWGNARADCTPDFIPIHWYATTPGNLIDYAKSFWEEFHIPLWITEYACQNFNGGAQCDEGQVWNLHQSVADWFDKTDYVQRYSPFGVMQQMQGVNQMNALMNPGGDITALGTWYIHSS